MNLNDDQKRIVEWLDGPVIVSAGPGSGKCVIGSTYVSTPDGMIQIKNAKNIDRAISIDLENHKPSIQSNTQWWDMGVHETITITTKSGIEITGTPEHPLLTWDGKFTWKRLSELVNGDCVLLYPGHSRDSGTLQHDPDLAYLLGLLIGDGYTRHSGYTVQFSRGGDYLPQRYYELTDRFFGVTPRKSQKAGTNSISHTITRKSVWKILEELEYPLEKTAKHKYIPPWIFRASLLERVRFLQGYFDTDGSVSTSAIELSSASETLIRQTQQLLLGIGVVSSIKPKKVSGYTHTYWMLYISGDQAQAFSELCGFRYESNKAKKLATVIDKQRNPNNGCYPDVSYLVYKLRAEWKNHKRWNGRDSILTLANGTTLNVHHTLKGDRNPSRATLRSCIEDCNSLDAKQLHLLTDLYPDFVVDTYEAGLAHVYDLTVPETHNFIANGIVSHNTRTVVERIARLIERGINPDVILATTFTKKAATEMTDRLKAKGIDTRNMSVQTSHSYCYRLLRDHPLYAHMKVDDKDESRIILKDILSYKDMNWRDHDITKVASFIATARNSLVPPDDSFKLEVFSSSLSPEYRHPNFIEAYYKYSNALMMRNILTFDDMLYYGVMLLINDSRTRETEQAKYQYLLVDEYQDSNHAQEVMFDIIAAPEMNYMAVGDVDQCIYTFRGSNPNYFLDFAKRYNAPIINLGMNYRSAKEILKRADNVIKNNSLRFSKELIAARDVKSIEKFSEARTTDDEANDVADEVAMLTGDGVKYSDMFVLMRTNAQTRAIEEVFTRRKLPFIILSNISFYNRAEIAGLLAYLEVIDDPGNITAGEKALCKPFRFTNRSLLNTIKRYAQEMSYVEAIEHALDETMVPNHIANGITSYADLIRKFDRNSNPSTALSEIVTKTRYVELLKREEGSDSLENNRESNVNEFISASTRFLTIHEFVEHIHKQMIMRKKSRHDSPGNRIQVMTIHKAKGMEARVVFLIGASSGFMPHPKATSAAEKEEERRLFYVAITRAKDAIYISSVESDFRGNYIAPSPYIIEAGFATTRNDNLDGELFAD